MKFPSIPKDDRRRVDLASLALIAGLLIVAAINHFFPMGRWTFLAIICVHVFVAGWIHGTMGVYIRRMKRAADVAKMRIRKPRNPRLH